jgi:predicted MFS family arabinose efflux permease
MLVLAPAHARRQALAGSVFGAVALTALQQAAPVDAHGRVMGVNATIQSWVEVIGLPLGGVTLAALGLRAGALALAGISVAAGLIGLGVVRARQPGPDPLAAPANPPPTG